MKEADNGNLAAATSWQACDHALSDHGLPLVDLPERQWIASSEVILGAMVENGPSSLDSLAYEDVFPVERKVL